MTEFYLKSVIDSVRTATNLFRIEYAFLMCLLKQIKYFDVSAEKS